MTKRCGKCSNCKVIESTKRIVLAECRPAGPGVNDQTVEMWNKVLGEHPCESTRRVDVRVTVNHFYPYGTPGHDDLSAREGHYFSSDTLVECILDAVRMYGTNISVQWWGDDPRRGQVIE